MQKKIAFFLSLGWLLWGSFADRLADDAWPIFMQTVNPFRQAYEELCWRKNFLVQCSKRAPSGFFCGKERLEEKSVGAKMTGLTASFGPHVG